MKNRLYSCIYTICMWVWLEESKLEKFQQAFGNTGLSINWANCLQNLVMAHKMLRPRVQMALENIDSFQYLMYKIYYKNQIWPRKNVRALIFLIPEAQMALENFGLILTPAHHQIEIQYKKKNNNI